MTIQRYELGVHCGMYCIGGMPTLTKTDYPSDDDVVKIADHLAAITIYEARIAEDAKVRAGLELALTAAIDRMCSEGCDCGTDEPETCALCVCEAALAAAKEIK